MQKFYSKFIKRHVPFRFSVIGISFALILFWAQAVRAQCPMPANSPGGTLDTCFNQMVSGLDGYVHALALQPDGKVLVGATSTDGNATSSICRLNADGTPDETFTQTIAGVNGFVSALALQPDGKVLVGGDFLNFNGRNFICRLNADGTPDETFTQTCLVGAHWVIAIALQPDGKILVGGRFNSTSINVICRLNADGSLDATFTQTGAGLNGIGIAIALQPDGKVLVGGGFNSYNGTPLENICRLNADGSLDATFASANTGLGLPGQVATIALQPDGKVLIGGVATPQFAA